MYSTRRACISPRRTVQIFESAINSGVTERPKSFYDVYRCAYHAPRPPFCCCTFVHCQRSHSSLKAFINAHAYARRGGRTDWSLSMSSLHCPPLASAAYMSLCVLLLLLLPIECNHLKTRLTFPSMATSIEIINKKTTDRP